MDPVRFRRLIDVVGQALERNGDDRLAFLHDECTGDPALLAEASALLMQTSNGAADAFTDRLRAHVLDAAARTVNDEVAISRLGERVGAWRLVGEIGHGGMGTVYAAERADDEYQARVAIKVVRGRLAAPEMVRRFRAERQILADLDHPNVARLLDGGTTSDGTPYLVMEYIEGAPIDAWCDARALGARDRVALFVQVCDAVAYAHGAGVIHRDLKPSNILVTQVGAPKLVDFGIAKLAGTGGDAEWTATGRVMTPTYASPEQVRGAPTSTASDVYSLGVVLYELLAGHPPFDLSHASAAEVERQICSVRPAPPSQAFRSSAAGPASRDAAWRRELTGRLDEIVLRALHKDPRLRHASAAALAEELRAHLTAPPGGRITALAPRARRFARRPMALAGAAAALVLASGVGFLGRARSADRVPALGGFALVPIPDFGSGFAAPDRVHSADVNGDGRPDLLWSHGGPESEQTRVGLANGDGTFSFGPAFTHPHMRAPAAGASYELIVGDFTGDGRADLAWHLRALNDKVVYVAISNGDGTFRAVEPQALPHTWFPIWSGHAADTDGDGRDDLFFIILGEENVLRAFRSRGDGTFEQAHWSIHPARRWSRYHTSIGDVDGDGRLDLIWNDVPAGMNRTYVARSLDSLRFVPWQDHPLSVQEDVPPERSRWAGYRTHVADIDGDARTDLVWIATGGDAVTIHRALGQPTAQFRFLDAQTIPRPAGAGPLATIAGDFNGDSRADILMYETAGTRFWIALGTPAGEFAMQAGAFEYPGGGVGGAAIIVDVTGDGRSDIVWYGASAAYVTVARGPGGARRGR